MARRRLAPVPMRRSVRMPMWAVAITSPPGGARAVFDAPVGAVRVRARYAVLPWGGSASLNTIASAFPPLWGAHSPSGGRTLGKPRPPSGVSARCVAEKRGRRAHIARAPAASFDPLNRPPAPHPNHHTAFYLV